MNKILFFTFFLSCFSAGAQQISDGLLLHYKFNGNLTDSGENGFDATNYGASFVEDRFGNPESALYFNGIDNYIEFPNESDLKPPLPLSFSFWIKYDSTETKYTYLLRTTFEYDRSTGISFNVSENTNRYGVDFRDGSYFLNPDSRRTLHSSKEIDTDNWHHIVAIVRGASDMQIYVDCYDYGGSYNGYGGGLVYSDTPGSIGRGQRITHGGIDYFKGTIDGFYYWNRELTLEEVNELCKAGDEMELTEYDSDELTVTPNPVKNILHIHSKTDNIEGISVYNSAGQKLLNLVGNRKSIDIGYLPSGVYYLEIKTQAKVLRTKFIRK